MTKMTSASIETYLSPIDDARLIDWIGVSGLVCGMYTSCGSGLETTYWITFARSPEGLAAAKKIRTGVSSGWSALDRDDPRFDEIENTEEVLASVQSAIRAVNPAWVDRAEEIIEVTILVMVNHEDGTTTPDEYDEAGRRLEALGVTECSYGSCTPTFIHADASRRKQVLRGGPTDE